MKGSAAPGGGEKGVDEEERQKHLALVAAEPGPPALREIPDEDDEGENIEPSFLEDPGQILKTLVIVLVLIARDLRRGAEDRRPEDAIAELGKASRSWIGVAIGATVLAFAADVALFRGVVGRESVELDWSECYQINMAGLAATRLFSAGGAGGIILTYWALRKAGMRRTESVRRMIAYLVLVYGVYMLAVIIFGVLLRVGVLPGAAPVSITIVPAGIAGAVAVFAIAAHLDPARSAAAARPAHRGRAASRG